MASQATGTFVALLTAQSGCVCVRERGQGARPWPSHVAWPAGPSISFKRLATPRSGHVNDGGPMLHAGTIILLPPPSLPLFCGCVLSSYLSAVHVLPLLIRTEITMPLCNVYEINQ
jgi:hypothetical protein